jgi:ketosteroid isomerase-like protein
VEPKDFASASARLQAALTEKTAAAASEPAHAHLRSVQSQIDAISKGDFDAVLGQAAPNVTLDIFAPPEFPWIRQARGIVELRKAMEQNFGSVDDQQPEITNVYSEGDAVVLFGRERGRIRATGQAYHMEFVQRFTFRDERLISVRIIAAHEP